MDRSFVFVHIGKTAGSTFRWLIRRHVPEGRRLLVKGHFHEFRSAEQKIRARVRQDSSPFMLFGHVSYGVHELIPQPSVYLTFLRRPVPRVVSGYDYARAQPHEALHAAATRRDLLSLIESSVYLDGDNGQVRRLSGVGESLPFGGCTEETLNLAIRNIEHHFATVGLTERFNESVVLMADDVGWPRPYYWTQNRARGQRAELDSKVLRRLQQVNELDEELYRYAERRLQEQIDRRGDGFHDRLRTFEVMNRYYFPVRILPERAGAKVRHESRKLARRARRRLPTG